MFHVPKLPTISLLLLTLSFVNRTILAIILLGLTFSHFNFSLLFFLLQSGISSFLWFQGVKQHSLLFVDFSLLNFQFYQSQYFDFFFILLSWLSILLFSEFHICVNSTLSAVLGLATFSVFTSLSSLEQLSSKFLDLSCLLNGHSVTFLDVSIWNFVSFLIMSSLLGLWGFSGYLEFDKTFVIFVLSLLAFLFSVWAVLSSSGNFLFLLFWEIMGMISFLLISTWQNSTYTVSSGFSAIGFNRLGDIALLLLQVSALSLPFSNSSFVTILIFALILKSVNFVTFLWLPEAMEGPTPVSSLLHSATLVMAGLFSFFGFGVGCTSTFIWISLFGFIFTTFLGSSEKDAKRTVAISTVILVSFLWVMFSLSLSETAVAICVIHAGYKSAFFLNLGKMISKSSTYSDVLGTSNSVKSLMVVVGIFLFGFSSTSYAAQKHAVDGLSVEGIGILCSIFILLGFLGTWLLTISITSSYKAFFGMSFFDLQMFLMIITLFILSAGCIGQSGNVASSACILIFPFLKFMKHQMFLNMGSISLSSNMQSVLVSSYEFLKLGVLSWKNLNLDNGILFCVVAIFCLILI